MSTLKAARFKWWWSRILLNHSAGGLEWAIDSPAPWLKPTPRRGRLPSGQQCPVGLSLQPPDNVRATHRLTLRISDRGGAERQPDGQRQRQADRR